jgi:hypothetical protein
MKLASLLLVSLSLLPSCAKQDSVGLDTPESQMDQQESVQAESDVLVDATDNADAAQSLTAGITADEVAATIAANITTRWNGCATATATGANVAVTYTDCSGPRNLVHVSGDLALAITIDVAAGAIDAHATSDSLKVNGADLQIDATAAYTRTVDTEKLVVHTTGSGIGPRGNTVDHAGDYTVTWDASTSCGAVDGHWQTDLSNATTSAERSNDVDVMRCGASCPTGSLTHHYLRGASLTLTFDGTAIATWSTSLGGSGTFALSCQ